MTRVLVVEDEESYREALAYMLRKEGFDVVETADGQFHIVFNLLALAHGPDGHSGQVQHVTDHNPKGPWRFQVSDLDAHDYSEP